ncbi:DUF2844 domain-containing protein [Paraburkholderia adhaesiva]|uniref:DUF2844 domain-containing protein n=1 Tax=Paraburkholderia adhaesiva TaxID=2883244 RepID=UPI001F16AABA|nr:DUF2844 domain-containing protein [Paraburkholderia adhaesiva]
MKERLICTGVAALLASVPAWAALGGSPSFHGVRSTPSSSVRVMAASGTAAAPWTVNTTTQDGGALIREYLDSSGTVFAVSWSGPRVASLDTLLGSYFPAWQKGLAAAHAARGGGHGPVTLRESGLVVESGGHMGALVGRAWLPQALPQGFTTDQIQ